MRKTFKHFIFLTSLVTAGSFTVTACNPSSPVITVEFSFNVSTKSKGIVYIGQDEQIKVTETKDKHDKTQRNYVYALIDSSDSKFLTVSDSGMLHPVSKTPKKDDFYEGEVLEYDYEVGVSITETVSGINRSLYLRVGEKYPEADGGYNFSSDKKAKETILGELESYAMSNFLTGISLFENGGYVRYSPRVHLGTSNYITGYGFGLLSEGHLHEQGTTWEPQVSWDRSYLSTASSSDPLDINAWDATGSQVADLNSYISTSYWGTKIDHDDTTKYEWYPVLAQDDCPDPVAIDSNGNELRTKEDFEEAGKSIFKTWRVYVKTDTINYHAANGASDDMKTLIEGDSNPETPATRHVSIDDYEFVFKMLLTGGTKLTRGTELASDTSYGIKGGYSYNIRTENYSGGTQDDYDDVNDIWDTMKADGNLGIKTSKDQFKSIDPETKKPVWDAAAEARYNQWKNGGNKDYIQFEFINPLDQFTAKYTLSSNLYSPIPEDFLGKVGGNITKKEWNESSQQWVDVVVKDKNWIKGGKNYGKFAGASSVADKVICLGPYHLDYWTKGQETAFQRSDDWFEYTEQGRYQIPGVHILIVDTSQHIDAIYSEFLQNKLDSTGIPSNRMSELQGTDKKTRGDSTFKLNVNACDQDRWNELFGKNGKIKKQSDNEYLVEEFMSNKNFLYGLWWSINRPAFAQKRGVNPSYDYFADAYLIDPDSGESYNSTDAHKKALTEFGIDLENDNYGYDRSKAIKYFKMAVSELTKEGKISYGESASNPEYLDLDIQWMYPSDESEYGQDIGNNFMDAFNDEAVCGKLIQLRVNHKADQNWTDVYYNHLMVGKFDLGFGAISGNSLNPLNFMEVLRSDNSSGFTLNWGADTGVFDENHPINFGLTKETTKEWSFDSLWAAADHGSVVSAGLETKIVKTGYIEETTDLNGNDVSDFRDGAIITIPFNFVVVEEGAHFNIERIQLFLIGAGTYSITSDHIKLLDANKEEITDPDTQTVYYIQLEFTKSMAQDINDQIFKGRKYQKVIDKLPHNDKYESLVDDYHHKFTYDNYYSKRDKKGLWAIEIYYSIHIAGAEETESEYDVLKNSDDDPNASQTASLARF